MKNFELVDELYKIGCFKFGSFKLKSGMITPFYIDLRLIISYPDLLQKVAEALWQKMQPYSFDRICGVPYNALPVATAISLAHHIPMLLKRKEPKDYGTKKQIEGLFQQGEQCAIVEDVIVSGKSILDTIEPIEENGVKVDHVFVIVDRQQGGKQLLEKQGLTVTPLLSVSEIFHHLRLKGKVSSHEVDMIKKFVETHQIS
jgi:uridine monophosphate synthetase